MFQLPVTARQEIEGGIWFFALEKTWLAVFPINLTDYQLGEINSKKIAEIYRNQPTLPAKIKKSNYTV